MRQIQCQERALRTSSVSSVCLGLSVRNGAAQVPARVWCVLLRVHDCVCSAIHIWLRDKVRDFVILGFYLDSSEKPFVKNLHSVLVTSGTFSLTVDVRAVTLWDSEAHLTHRVLSLLNTFLRF